MGNRRKSCILLAKTINNQHQHQRPKAHCEHDRNAHGESGAEIESFFERVNHYPQIIEAAIVGRNITFISELEDFSPKYRLNPNSCLGHRHPLFFLELLDQAWAGIRTERLVPNLR